MYLVYSAIDTIITNQLHADDTSQYQPDHELMLRYRAYQAACDKFSYEITAIQKYIPGWTPKFSY
jgi:hypothetical protein